MDRSSARARNRGIYAVFPLDPEVSASQLGPHMDQSMTEMSAVTYLEDVPPNSGGFTIYPTSPQLLYPTSAQALNWVATDRSSEVLDQIKSEIQPLEFTGHAGDTIFCHGWIVHSAGIHETDRIRFAAIQDFNKVRQRSHMRWTAAGKNGGPRVNCDMDGVFRFADESDDDPADGYREVTNQWIMDSNEFVLARDAPYDDMFREWNLGQRPVEGQHRRRTRLVGEIQPATAAHRRHAARDRRHPRRTLVGHRRIRRRRDMARKIPGQRLDDLVVMSNSPTRPRPRFEVASARRGLLPGVDALKLNQLVDELEVEAFVNGTRRPAPAAKSRVPASRR